MAASLNSFFPSFATVLGSPIGRQASPTLSFFLPFSYFFRLLRTAQGLTKIGKQEQEKKTEKKSQKKRAVVQHIHTNQHCRRCRKTMIRDKTKTRKTNEIKTLNQKGEERKKKDSPKTTKRIPKCPDLVYEVKQTKSQTKSQKPKAKKKRAPAIRG